MFIIGDLFFRAEEPEAMLRRLKGRKTLILGNHDISWTGKVDLARVIDGEKALPLGECARLGIALAKGLAALQRHHLLHRDIKPGNVIYVAGRPVLSDPGLLVEESEAASLVGTPGYVPPENFTDAAGDIYSLGLTLKAASFGRKVEDIDKGPSMEADTDAPLFPAWWRILNKATDPTPSRRYQSAKALVKDLENLRRKIAVASLFGSRIAKAVIALSAVAVIAFVVFAVVTSRRTQNEIVQQSEDLEQLKKFKTGIEERTKKRDGDGAAPDEAGRPSRTLRCVRRKHGGRAGHRDSHETLWSFPRQPLPDTQAPYGETARDGGGSVCRNGCAQCARLSALIAFSTIGTRRIRPSAYVRFLDLVRISSCSC